MSAQLAEKQGSRLRIRRAKPEDARAIAAMVASAEDLRQVSPLEDYPLDGSTVVHWLLDRDAGQVLEDRGEIVAYGELVPDRGNPDRYWIGHMIVHPRRRGLGFGQRLVHELIRIAEVDRDAREVAISAFADNERALRCYEGCGFVRTDREQIQGRALVGMRLRFASRRRAPGPVELLVTGVVATALAAGAFAARLGLELVAALVVMLVAAPWMRVAFRERRDPWWQRAGNSALAPVVGGGAGVVAGSILLALTGGEAELADLLWMCASATLAWIALLAVSLRLRG